MQVASILFVKFSATATTVAILDCNTIVSVVYDTIIRFYFEFSDTVIRFFLEFWDWFFFNFWDPREVRSLGEWMRGVRKIPTTSADSVMINTARKRRTSRAR